MGSSLACTSSVGMRMCSRKLPGRLRLVITIRGAEAEQLRGVLMIEIANRLDLGQRPQWVHLRSQGMAFSHPFFSRFKNRR